jgi:hypothetical protein
MGDICFIWWICSVFIVFFVMLYYVFHAIPWESHGIRVDVQSYLTFTYTLCSTPSSPAPTKLQPIQAQPNFSKTPPKHFDMSC